MLRGASCSGRRRGRRGWCGRGDAVVSAARSFRRFKETTSMLRSSSSFVWVLWLVFAWAGTVTGAPAQGWVDRTGPNGPGPKRWVAMCYDPVRAYTLMVGATGQYLGSSGAGCNFPTETWSWNGAAWTNRQASVGMVADGLWTQWGTRPLAMALHAATNDVLLAMPSSYGAVPGFFGYGVSLLRWDGATWAMLGSFGISEPSRDIGMAYDASRQETVIFAGYAEVGIWNGTVLTSRVATSMPPWASPCAPGSTSTSYRFHSMAFDPVAGKVLLCEVAACNFGSVVYFAPNQVPPRFFEWSGFGWNQRMPASLPLNGLAAMSTDTSRNRVVMLDADYQSFLPNHTWSYANGICTQLATSVEPTRRFVTAMSYDPVRGVHVLFGGSNGPNVGLADTWEFDLGPLASFTPYGTGCAGSRGVPTLIAQTNSLPRIGQTFTTRTTNLPWTGPALMLVGLSDTNYSGTPLPADLSMLSAPGCFLRTSIDDVQPVQNVLGTALWSFVIPPVPGAQFFLQTVPFDPAVNPLNLTFSNGGRAVVGL
jgi:hypothetical protein